MNFLSRFFYYLYVWVTPGKIKATAIHPEYKRLIEFAFEADHNGKKIKFYGFKSLHDMPVRRFRQFNMLLEDHNRKLSQEELSQYVDEIQANLVKNSMEGITNATVLTKHLQARVRIGMDSELYLRLISCAYFTMDENLLEYDWDIGTERIKIFQDQGVQAFFLSEPLRKFLPSIDISPTDLAIFSKQKELTKAYLKQLTEAGILSPRDTSAQQKRRISS